MGMIGSYYAMDNDQIHAIAEGTLDLEQLTPEPTATLDIDKSWQIINYLLCGNIIGGEPPLGYIVPMLGENLLDFGDFGAFYLYHKQVVEGYNAVAALTKEDVLARYDFKAMQQDGVYPITEEEDSKELFDYLYTHLNAIQSFYQKAAADGHGVVFYVL